MRAAAGLAVAASLILALREPLHGWVEKLTWPELRSALVLLAMTFIALPIVPDTPIGPFGGVNRIGAARTDRARKRSSSAIHSPFGPSSVSPCFLARLSLWDGLSANGLAASEPLLVPR
jgi:hypothetical protein